MHLEKPLYSLLLVSLALTALTLLLPPAEPLENHSEDDLLADTRPLKTAELPAVQSWQRTAYNLSQHPSPPLGSTAISGTAIKTTPAPVINTPTYVAPEPPLRPAAPSPGFRYLGRLQRDQVTWIFLEQGDNTYAVALGQTFEGKWRLDGVHPDRLEMTYLPLHAAKTLPLQDE